MPPAPLSGATRLVPILAHPVDHVRAPRFYNPAFAAAGLDWCLVPMGVPPRHLAGTIAQLAHVGNLQGLNITLPHKAAAHALCARVGPEARRTGVVNTMRLDPDGRWTGESFDGIGFVDAARAHGVLKLERPVALIGAGGAGTAIAFALIAAGVREIGIVDAEMARAERLVQSLCSFCPEVEAHTRAEGLGRAGLAINATPLGLHAGDPMPFDPALLRADAALFDIVAARDTELMAACAARGLPVVGGRPMIEHQIAVQIAFWRGGT
ncbi:Shikimate dehydrogenase [Variovorax sp. PBL-H6]|uniref:shikimate dehydrogenase family protein n=1 Tax=Variovorax sp. PBL-H6 TaxID=434009 RepID=UPI00131985F3|nr:shikimate dehydrogenase [Variovorax sp. PBL-H6]VTU38101.1 Shikimate dehydrogenase [Variovorax sp. PBL-H6]